jgi:hypothetical protein
MSTDGLILVVVLVLVVLGVAYGLFTARGSGITHHRHRDQRTPGSSGPAEELGIGQGEGVASGSELNGASDPQRGTR